MISKSEQINELVTALAIVQGKLQPAIKDRTNPFYKATYADLTSVWDACRSLLSENKLAIIQTINTENNVLSVITTLAHASGQWTSSNISSSIEKLNPQQIGSMISYYRRYGLSSMVGVVTEDDDANATIKKGDSKSDNREVKSNSGLGSSAKSNGPAGQPEQKQPAKPNGAQLSPGPQQPSQKLNPEFEKLSKTKFTSGLYSGSTFEQAFTFELKENHKWSKQMMGYINEGKKLPEITLQYLEYAQGLGAQI